MDIGIIAMLAGAGLLGGVMNSLAGGATLITFPAMLAAGIPPISANASSAVAVTPGHMAAAIADRHMLRGFGPTLWLLLGLGMAAGAAGSWLLLITPEATFRQFVPVLIGAATLLFALGSRLRRQTDGVEHRPAHRLRAVLVIPSCIYGGYFGAGLGIMLLAVITLTGPESLRIANTLKNMLASVVSIAAITIFVIQGAISWPETLVMLTTALIGGLIGSRLVAILPPRPIRLAIIALGTVMTVLYAYRMW